MSRDRYTIREATLADKAPICGLLAQLNLGANNVLAPSTRYWLAEDATSRMVGVVGLEYGQQVVLLRSAGVHPDSRGCALGTELVRRALDSAAAEGYTSTYLFSTGAGDYWTRLGFVEVPVSEVVAALPNAPQVREYDALGWLPTEVAWRRVLWQVDKVRG